MDIWLSFPVPVIRRIWIDWWNEQVKYNEEDNVFTDEPVFLLLLLLRVNQPTYSPNLSAKDLCTFLLYKVLMQTRHARGGEGTPPQQNLVLKVTCSLKNESTQHPDQIFPK